MPHTCMTRTPQHHEGKEQLGLPAGQSTEAQPPGRLVAPKAQAVANVWVAIDLIWMGVMGAVLCDPPLEAQSDQTVSDGQPQNLITKTGSKDLLVPCVVRDEAQLGEHHAQECGDAECPPRTPRSSRPRTQYRSG
jgi:hypothetical protein